MSTEDLSSTSGASRKRAKKRKAEETAKLAGSMNRFLVPNKAEIEAYGKKFDDQSADTHNS